MAHATPSAVVSRGLELYDHEGDDGTDFDAFENENLAGRPGVKAVELALHETLVQHFQHDGALIFIFQRVIVPF